MLHAVVAPGSPYYRHGNCQPWIGPVYIVVGNHFSLESLTGCKQGAVALTGSVVLLRHECAARHFHALVSGGC